MKHIFRKVKVQSLNDRDQVTLCVNKVGTGNWDIVPEDSRLRHISGRYNVPLSVVLALGKGAIDPSVVEIMENAPDVNYLNPKGVTVRLHVTAKRARKMLGEFRKDYGVARGVAKATKIEKGKPWMKGAGYLPRSQRRRSFVSTSEAAVEKMTSVFG